MGKKKGKKAAGKKTGVIPKQRLVAKIESGDIEEALELIATTSLEQLKTNDKPRKNLLQICLEKTAQGTDCTKLINAMLEKEIIELQNLSSLEIKPHNPLAIDAAISLYEVKYDSAGLDGREIVMNHLVEVGSADLMLVVDEFYKDQEPHHPFHCMLLLLCHRFLRDWMLF